MPKADSTGAAARVAAVDPRLTLQSVVRTFQVLEAVGRAGRPRSLGEIASMVSMDKSAVQRAVATLQGLGYLERAENGNGFVPGRRILDRTYDYLRMTPIIERATPVLIELRKTARERVDLSLLDDVSIVYAIRLQSKRENFPATLIGRRLPVFFTSGGRAMLALMDDAKVDDILDRSELRPITQKTIFDLPGIRGKIAEARRDGYALAVEESLIGEVVLAAAVTDADGAPIAAVHIAASLSEWTVADFRARFGPLALEAAKALSR
ncbi:IclR family transcriptional regulator [Aquibium sp. A9E412]|uniref:IclR family transcriptional regulator n=1 Tax=Aquibium sp. A9E412 TaxID=2976767 RepID=UPI0025B0E0EA|nr:IclR family transcriptional regulator [Aquibium sp. A9E412]MDN2567762.1 IclR family transcriptional regulator [Aquibium sp. A9E412]